MEIIPIAGYSLEDKLPIAKRLVGQNQERIFFVCFNCFFQASSAPPKDATWPGRRRCWGGRGGDEGGGARLHTRGRSQVGLSQQCHNLSVINYRTLERQLGALCRAVAVSLAEEGEVFFVLAIFILCNMAKAWQRMGRRERKWKEWKEDSGQEWMEWKFTVSLMFVNPRKTARGHTTLTCSLWKRFALYFPPVGRYAAYCKLDHCRCWVSHNLAPCWKDG